MLRPKVLKYSLSKTETVVKAKRAEIYSSGKTETVVNTARVKLKQLLRPKELKYNSVET